MILKSMKLAAVAVGGTALVGGVLFGTDLGSYVSSSIHSVRTAANDNVPMEFQLQRARHMLDDIIPEMQANVRLLAQQEVEIANLKQDIAQSDKSLAQEQTRVQRLREAMGSEQSHYVLGGLSYTRAELKEELARRFDALKEAEIVLAGKTRLLSNQERALRAATAAIDRTRGQKLLLEGQIASLEAQYRLVQATSSGSKLGLDQSKLAQTERLIAQVKKQLDVAERVLAHEAKFTDSIPVDVVDEKALVAEVDEHFGKASSEHGIQQGVIVPGDEASH
jgi:hypothetical protein